MIVKVQISIHPIGTEALVYAEGKKWLTHFPVEDLPDAVFEATRELGKSYFHAELHEGKIVWGVEAPWQEW